MKKTLIALMALASVATVSAETLKLSADAKNSDGNKNSDYTVTVTDDGLAGLTKGNIMLDWIDDPDDEYDYSSLSSWEISFTLKVNRDSLTDQNLLRFSDGTTFAINNNGTVEFYNGVINFKNEAGNTITSINSDADSPFVSAVKTSTAITLSFVAYQDVNTNKIIGGLLSAISGDSVLSVEISSSMDLKDAATVIWTNSGGEPFSNISVSTLNNKLVPEPTTATLSLLALAGLAVRRRRR